MGDCRQSFTAMPGSTVRSRTRRRTSRARPCLRSRRSGANGAPRRSGRRSVGGLRHPEAVEVVLRRRDGVGRAVAARSGRGSRPRSLPPRRRIASSTRSCATSASGTASSRAHQLPPAPAAAEASAAPRKARLRRSPSAAEAPSRPGSRRRGTFPRGAPSQSRSACRCRRRTRCAGAPKRRSRRRTG